MLTRNYVIGYAARLTKEYSETYDYGDIINHLGNHITKDTYTKYLDDYGTLFTAVKAGSSPTVSTVAAGKSAGPKGFVFGNGDAPESFDDFKMAGDHFTTFTHTCSKTISLEDDAIVATYLFTLTNTGTEEFTIREIGQFGYPGSSTNMSALLERTVLKSPVTIPAGGIGQVTYTMRIPLTA